MVLIYGERKWHPEAEHFFCEFWSQLQGSKYACSHIISVRPGSRDGADYHRPLQSEFRNLFADERHEDTNASWVIEIDHRVRRNSSCKETITVHNCTRRHWSGISDDKAASMAQGKDNRRSMFVHFNNTTKLGRTCNRTAFRCAYRIICSAQFIRATFILHFWNLQVSTLKWNSTRNDNSKVHIQIAGDTGEMMVD